MSSNRFNCIVLLDSIPQTELNTARRLHEDIESYASAFAPFPPVAYVRVEDRNALFGTLDECRERAEREDFAPLLHIECHGDESGFQLADGSLVDWGALKAPLIGINVPMRLNLMVVVAACTGGALAAAVDVADPAPLWGLIGPTRVVTPAELEAAYGEFYRTLISTKSPSDAVAALDRVGGAGTFWRTTAEELFWSVWTRYRNTLCTPTALLSRARRMQKRARADGYQVKSVEEFKRVLSETEPLSFERFKEAFFMCKRYPEHRERFRLEERSSGEASTI